MNQMMPCTSNACGLTARVNTDRPLLAPVVCASCVFWTSQLRGAEPFLVKMRGDDNFYWLDPTHERPEGPQLRVKLYVGAEIVTVRMKCIGLPRYAMADNGIIGPATGPIGLRRDA